MAVAFVFIGNIEFCPYINNYIKILEEKNIEYTVYYWDRAVLKSKLGERYVAFPLASKLAKNKISKLFDFNQYFIWINKKLKGKKYEKIILLDTLSAFIIKKQLTDYRYILEIRDYSYENNFLFKRIESKIIEKSFCTFVSSPGFFSFLPKNQNYTIAHNISNAIERKKINAKKDIQKTPINIVWAGSVRYYSAQISIISQIKNDKRIQLFYHGTGPQKENLEQYCIDNGIHNVVFTGRYDEKNKQRLYDDADFILNAYDPSIGNEVKYALSNRFYDSIMMRLPQIVEDGSYKAELVKKNGLGIVVTDKCLKIELINFYEEYSRELFEKKCSELYQKFSYENIIAIEQIEKFLE